MASATTADIQRLFDAGAHFAQVRSRRHPSMKPFLLGAKGRMEILDLAKTEEQINEAKRVLEALSRDGKIILMVGGKPEIAGVVREAAHSAHTPYVATRWLGGTLSNWTEIKKRIDRLAELTDMSASGALAKQHTKLERVRLDREMKRLAERLDGIQGLSRRPDALLVVDPKHEKHAIKEAKALRLPVIAIMSSDCDIKDATFPVVANDASQKAVKILLTELSAAIEKGRTV
jgi:small subunit ribosomal protein S2